MELQRQALSITKGRMPARFASMAVSRPVGPAPIQMMSYVSMGFAVCREFFRIANQEGLLPGWKIERFRELAPESLEFVQFFRSGLHLVFFPDKHIAGAAFHFYAEVSFHQE